MVCLLVLADDFTGALDTGVQFSKQGVQTQVTLDCNMDFALCEREVLVVDTETRHLSREEAHCIVSKLARRARQCGVKFIYKKTDSALRGNVGAELAAVLESDEQVQQLMFFPAYPQMNRVTREGIHYIDGEKVTQSPFGKDPFEPVTEDNVVNLIGKQTNLFAKSVSLTDSVPEERGIMVFDAQTREDLMHRGQQLMAENKLHFMAGCAGFAEFLPQLLPLQKNPLAQMPKLTPELLVVCGSVNPITTAQLSQGEKWGFKRIYLSPRQKLTENYWTDSKGREELLDLVQAVNNHSYCIVEGNDFGSVDNQLTKDYVKEHGLEQDTVRRRISTCLGEILKSVMENSVERTVLLTGGDTLLQCMDSMGVTELEPLFELEKGVVLASFSHEGKKKYIITKSGGFGEENLLVNLAEKIKN